MIYRKLPEKYQRLVEKRLNEYTRRHGELFTPKAYARDSTVDDKFSWSGTPEPSGFWGGVHYATNIEDLPPIPEDSLAEIEPSNPNLKV